jgi:FkbM family methyltransferase
MLTTKTKVSLAAFAYKVVALGRSAVGKDHRATVRRGGLRWNLDLNEGIDFSIYLLGAFERSTVSTLRKLVKPGDTVFDIGANIGAHTLGMARSVGVTGRVFAFEPADFAFAKLKRNLALNPDLAVRTRAEQLMLSAAPGDLAQEKIYASWPLKADVTVHPKHRGRLVSALGASADTLDHFVAQQAINRLDLIKLDVDGHELPVLRGGREVLQKHHPILVMEMSPYVHAEEHSSFADLVALLRDAGYSLQDAGTWKPLPLEAGALEQLIPDGASINVIARAESR